MFDKFFNKISHIGKNQEGSILVISVLIMSIMGVIVFSLSTYVIRQIDFSHNLDNAMLAYYAAESSMEEALYDVRKSDSVKLSEDGVFSNKVNWRRVIVPVKDDLTFPIIEKNKFVQLDLFDTDDLSCSSGVETSIYCDWESMLLTWEGDGGLQVTITSWARDSEISFDPDSLNEVKYISASSSWLINELDSSMNHRVKIKAVTDDVSDVKVTLFKEDNAFGGVVPVPNFLTIKGEGISGKNHQVLTVTVPRKAPLSSLYDYVLFSEEDIVKEL